MLIFVASRPLTCLAAHRPACPPAPVLGPGAFLLPGPSAVPLRTKQTAALLTLGMCAPACCSLSDLLFNRISCLVAFSGKGLCLAGWQSCFTRGLHQIAQASMSKRNLGSMMNASNLKNATSITDYWCACMW